MTASVPTKTRADYISTRTRGIRLGDNGYAPIEPDANGRLLSEQLGLELAVQGDRLKFFDAQRGAYLPDYSDLQMALEVQTERAEQETLARIEAETENARLRAELARLQRKDP